MLNNENRKKEGKKFGRKDTRCQFHQRFCTKVLSADFLYSRFGFVTFWWKDIGKNVHVKC